MYYASYNRKKEIIKNVVIITIILLIAVLSTYYIYHKFSDDGVIDYSSKSLDIVFHGEEGEELNITKITPLTDSVGLSSKSHTITITNNLTETVKYKIKVVDNVEKMLAQNCEGITIPKDEIRISVKEGNEETKIYKLSDIGEDGILISTKSKALETKKITIKIWINNDTTLPSGSIHHYHGLIQVVENDTTLTTE